MYDPTHGFYATSGHAGRRGDFITSPEVGPLFGQLMANFVDREWDRCGRPEEFVFVDVGAGPGTLARAIVTASPRCGAALRYVAVEVSAAQRAAHPEGVESVAEMPTEPFVGVVLANELLDNLAFTPVAGSPDGLVELRVGLDGDALVEVSGGLLSQDEADHFESGIERGVLQRAAASWVSDARSLVRKGSVVVIDYARTRSENVEVRTYLGHERGDQPLTQLGRNDVTVDVDLAQLQSRVGTASTVTTQADFLGELGVDALVEEGRAIWEADAAVGDLAALKARSRIREAEALLDPAGLGGFTVAIWHHA